MSFEADLGSVKAAWLRQFQAGQVTVLPLAGALGLCQDALGLLTSSKDVSGTGNKYTQSLVSNIRALHTLQILLMRLM